MVLGSCLLREIIYIGRELPEKLLLLFKAGYLKESYI